MDIFKTLIVGSPPSRTYTGSAVGLLTAANNLSDVADAATAFANLTAGAVTLGAASSISAAATTNLTLAGGSSGGNVLLLPDTSTGYTYNQGWFNQRAGKPFAFNSKADSTYYANGYAAAIVSETSDGRLAFYTAPSGTAGGAITFTERLSIVSSGNVLVGTTSESGLSGAGNLKVNGAGVFGGNLTVSGTGASSVGGTFATGAPTGGAGAWKLGIANAVSPTSPNRTITIDIGGTLYYLHAKTTND